MKSLMPEPPRYFRADFEVWIDRDLNFRLWWNTGKHLLSEDEGCGSVDCFFGDRPSVCEDLRFKYVPMDCI